MSPSPPAASLRDDSDADDARGAVFRISLYHIPDSASLASSASFGFRVFRSIIVFVRNGSKPPASFHYKRDGGDDGDGLSCIPLPISHALFIFSPSLHFWGIYLLFISDSVSYT